MNMSSRSQGWSRRQFLHFAAGAAGSLGLHACTQTTSASSDADSSQLPAISFAVTSWIGNSALYIAQAKNFFKTAGLELNLRTYSTVAESFPAFSNGQLQGIAPVTSEAVSLAADGMNHRIVAVMDTSAGADAILARNSVRDIRDFKGKRIAVQKGGVGHFFLLQILSEAGLEESDVTLVDTTPEASASAFEAGDIEIAYSYSPYIEKALAGRKDGRVIYDSSKMPTAIADLYTFSADFIQTNPQAVKAFVSGIFQALDFLKTNPDEALSIAAKPLGVSSGDLANQLKGVRLTDLATNREMLTNPQSNLYLPKSMTALATFLKKHSQIQTAPDMAKLIDPQFVLALSK